VLYHPILQDLKVESEIVRVAMLSKLYFCPVISVPFKYLLFSSPLDVVDLRQLTQPSHDSAPKILDIN
jgi:hypothetical protein